MDTTSGNVGIGTGAGVGGQKLTVGGNVQANQFIGQLVGPKVGYVLDQFVNNLGDALEQGDVIVIGDNQSSLYYGPNDSVPVPEVDIAQQAYDRRVCGIVNEVHAKLQLQAQEDPANTGAKSRRSTKRKGAKGADQPVAAQIREFTAEETAELDRTKVEPGHIGGMVTLGAYAHCKVDADIAPIQIGDLLTTSPTKGHAQKVLDINQAMGAIIGKALGSLDKGKGKLPVMVMLQ
jgi:hypothetical protein